MSKVGVCVEVFWLRAGWSTVAQNAGVAASSSGDSWRVSGPLALGVLFPWAFEALPQFGAHVRWRTASLQRVTLVCVSWRWPKPARATMKHQLGGGRSHARLQSCWQWPKPYRDTRKRQLGGACSHARLQSCWRWPKPRPPPWGRSFQTNPCNATQCTRQKHETQQQ